MYILKNLNFYRKDVYSQNGEDGIIEEILKRLNIQKNLQVVEFGACDGKSLSNTFNLIKEKKVDIAVYIESDLKLYNDLEKNAQIYKSILPLNTHVEIDDINNKNLDSILKKTRIKKNFDILSIDIDSYDLDVFLSIKDYHPKILIIEANKVALNIYHKHNNKKFGNSFSQIIKDVKPKNYLPIVFTGNLIFIKSELIGGMSISNKIIKNPNILYDYQNFFYKYKKMNLLSKYLILIVPIELLKMLNFFKKFIADKINKV